MYLDVFTYIRASTHKKPSPLSLSNQFTSSTTVSRNSKISQYILLEAEAICKDFRTEYYYQSLSINLSPKNHLNIINSTATCGRTVSLHPISKQK